MLDRQQGKNIRAGCQHNEYEGVAGTQPIFSHRTGADSDVFRRQIEIRALQQALRTLEAEADYLGA